MPRVFFAILFVISFSACQEEDPGPRQQDVRQYNYTDFDRLQLSDAMVVTIHSGATFTVRAEGDRRNLDDLRLIQNGTTLTVEFDKNRERQYTTYLTITLPTLLGLSMSGAVEATATGFESPGVSVPITLSGASVAQVSIEAEELNVNISGASQLRLHGEASNLRGYLDGASLLHAFNLPVSVADFQLSGASQAKVQVSQLLKANVNGASEIRYLGSPVLNVTTSGSSFVRPD